MRCSWRSPCDYLLIENTRKWGKLSVRLRAARMSATPLLVLLVSLIYHPTDAFLPALEDIGDVYLNSVFDACPQVKDSWNSFHQCAEKESPVGDDPFQFCKTLASSLKCNEPVISSMRGCNHTADDLISLIEAHSKAFQFLCVDGGQRYLELSSKGPLCALVNPADCPDSFFHKLNEYFINEKFNSSSYFNTENCKLIKEAVDCFSTSLSNCPTKIALLLQMVNNIFLNSICAGAIIAAQ